MKTRALAFLAIPAFLAIDGCSGSGGPAPADPDGPGPGGKTDAAASLAPSWLLSVEGSGAWEDPKLATDDQGHSWRVVRGWVDARVRNTRFDKRVFVEVAAPYEGGVMVRTLHPAWFKGSLGNNDEKWGTDTIEVYPDGGPGSKALAGPAMFRLRIQEDLDHDGTDGMLVTAWAPLFGEGEPIRIQADPWAPGWNSPSRPPGGAGPPEVYFPPFDDAGAVVVREIDRVIAARAAAPGERHTIHAAVFNINDPRITDRLIAAHRAGVEVRLVTEATKFRPQSYWQTEDDRLFDAGVPLVGVRRQGRGAMHVKFAVFDGRVVATGSFNWEVGSSAENHEDLVLTSDPGLVRAYSQRFQTIAGEVEVPRDCADDPSASVSVSFAPDEEPYRIAGRILDSAMASIHTAMFTCKNVEYTEDGRHTSLFDKLVAAVQRGVDVTVVTDFGVSEASEYFGTVNPDDPADEWLEERGVHVVRADNPFGRYASMHHKFTVVDRETVLFGAFNWYYDAAFLNDEDQVVWRDPALAADFGGEFADLLCRYDPAFLPADWPLVDVQWKVTHAGTSMGDTVLLVGDQPELGQWDPAGGIAMDPASWPVWSATVHLAAGVRIQYKFATRHQDGSVSWESGDNRTLRVPTQMAQVTFDASFR